MLREHVDYDVQMTLKHFKAGEGPLKLTAVAIFLACRHDGPWKKA